MSKPKQVTLPFLTARIKEEYIYIKDSNDEDEIKEEILKQLKKRTLDYPFLETKSFDETDFTIMKVPQNDDSIEMQVNDKNKLRSIRHIQAECFIENILNNSGQQLVSPSKDSLIDFKGILNKYKEIKPHLFPSTQKRAEEMIEKYAPIAEKINDEWKTNKTEAISNALQFFPSRETLKKIDSKNLEEDETKINSVDSTGSPQSFP
ncbi:hypothetical protein [Legionella fairfieldensis]|uniref:hypothetical protein n=1 Tax=Legionella fairfieldensis TaxID=45064 RepID=UPI000491FD24|nr:hypothetical protein [Legionella fairfieldensis]